MPFISTPERVFMKEALKKGIAVALKLKFGADGVALMPEIESLTDHEVLGAVLEAIEDAQTPDDVRRIWAPKRRGTKKRSS